jgi:hypothetical protein
MAVEIRGYRNQATAAHLRVLSAIAIFRQLLKKLVTWICDFNHCNSFPRRPNINGVARRLLWLAVPADQKT